ncbi:DUF1376 domain-containing protein [Variovorax sp. NFACC27]|uniref:DUF1376 domain-containing protein n=1 Tax=unclassified Variovorax TaxID=663243 RepID=UPI00089BF8F0|nr:Uncharacterized conserved protein YdaU, DUF1376 family [Variovorax sp. NFACC28]SEF72310.1 Uncharacterized conserved protein YdaU, DUF1376 family [Variovorax sp. NFACC29]SFB77153.1 Uncharacterized conserved protein YdaU, DUF1376 family [Variovorax sp. NFACC26]SFG76789.1 Uncharacterized conserved protein YdaU, DUF1376 family [Variovorax sp. NFACC27]
MNYFELHIGDYAEATQHLSILEDGVYTRMLRKYYASEKPLPAEIEKVQRLIVAKSDEEKAAVEVVLSEFFVLRDDGWHQERCDDEIARYQAGEPERVAKKANEDARTERHRQERASLFAALTKAGKHAAWNTSIKDLRALVAALPQTAPATPVTTPETFEGPGTVTAPATPVTATQTPLPTTHLPLPTTQNKEDTPLTPQGGKRRRKPAVDLGPLMEGFEVFYAAYGNKVGRKDAEKAWIQLSPDDALQAVILGAIAAQKPHRDYRESGRFIKYPASWLRGEHWNDEVPGAKTKAAPVTDDGRQWWEVAGFEHPGEAANARCHVLNYHEFRDGKRIVQEASA